MNSVLTMLASVFGVIPVLKPKALCNPLGEALAVERRVLASRYWWCSAFDDCWLWRAGVLATVAEVEVLATVAEVDEESDDFMSLDVYSDCESSDVLVGSKRKRYFE